MAQNLIYESEEDPILCKAEHYMLWDAIFHHHFPPHLGYGVAHQTSITSNGRLEFLVVRSVRESEHVVLVAGLEDSDSLTQDDMDNAVQELVNYIKECFRETGYPTIYGIAGIDFTWTALKINRTDPNQPITLVPWYGALVSNTPFLFLKAVANEIHKMTEQVWLSYFTVFWPLDNSLRRLYPHRPLTVPIPHNPLLKTIPDSDRRRVCL